MGLVTVITPALAADGPGAWKFSSYMSSIDALRMRGIADVSWRSITERAR
jgi:hypothetical protein